MELADISDLFCKLVRVYELSLRVGNSLRDVVKVGESLTANPELSRFFFLAYK